MASEHELEQSLFPLTALPFDCIFCICEYLSAKDLARFSGTCKFFHDVVVSESLWRQQVLHRWQFGDVCQVPAGPGRWRRYFLARRRIEASIEQGRPTRDYRVKTLRGHKAKVVCCVCLGGSSIDWEHMVPPLVVSMAEDGTVLAWDAKEGKPVWTLEDQSSVCLAGNDKENEIAVGSSAGHVTVYSASDWSVKCVLTPPTESETTELLALQYGCIKKIKGKLDHSFLLVSSVQDDQGVITLWNVSQPASPLAILSPYNHCTGLLLSHSGWLAAFSMDFREIYVWDLTELTLSSPSSPSPPHVTLHPSTNPASTPIWLRPGLLATYTTSSYPHFMLRRSRIHNSYFNASSSNSELWDINQHLKEGRGHLAYQPKHMYNSRIVKLEAPPTTAAYFNGVLVMGDEIGVVRVVDPMTGTCLQRFHDHKGAVTDLHVDSFRVLSCSRDYSIRVYQWLQSDESSTPQLRSRYQLLGGSVALKKHDGFHQVSCEAGSCVGVAGDMIKLYTFFHQLENIHADS